MSPRGFYCHYSIWTYNKACGEIFLVLEMPLLPKARTGSILRVRQYPVEFNFWPVYQSARRDGLESKLFVTNPWAIIRSSINTDCPAGALHQALAFLEQAEYYFRTANNSETTASKPILFYYCFLNLAKAYVLKNGTRNEYGYKAYHGLEVDLGTLPGVTPPSTPSVPRELIDSYMSARRSMPASPPKPPAVNIFDDFYKTLTGNGLLSTTHYPLCSIMPQVLQWHRLWCKASSESERFIAIEKIELKDNSKRKEIWLNLRISDAELNRYGLTHSQLLRESRLDTLFREVRGSVSKKTRKPKLIKFEQLVPLSYTDRVSDELQALVDSLKGKVWVNILSTPPYRKYYLYRAPAAEHQYVLPQLLSIYALFYYLSSVTRYRPHMYSEIISGEYGALIQEATWNLPNQFLYLMASNFAKREVTKGAFV